MNVKRVVFKLIAIILCVTLLLPAYSGTIYAETLNSSEKRWFGIIPMMEDSKPYMGYSIGGQTKIFNIVEYQSESDPSYVDENVYCIKEGVGFATQQGDQILTKQRKGYDTYFNFKDLRNNESQLNPKVVEILNDTFTEGSNTYKVYNCLLALFDIMYLPGKSTSEEKDELFKIILDEAKKSDSGYQDDYELIQSKGPLTDNDISAALQTAIWYFSNYHDNKYDKTEAKDWVYYIENNDTNYKSLSNYMDRANGDTSANDSTGKARSEQINILYNYLIKKAKANSYLYDNVSSQSADVPAKVDTEFLQSEKLADRIIVGPIHITELASKLYTVDLKVKNKNEDVDSYQLLDSSKTVVSGKTAKDLVGKDFYISVPASQINNLSVDVTINYNNKEMTLWTVSNSNNEQPLVEIKQKPQSEKVTLNLKPLDLALRKYITQINGAELKQEDRRNIDIDKSTIESENTAKYKHKKSAVEVHTNDIVTYDITIYNEGGKSARATKVVDQLPTGLKFMQVASGNFDLENYDETTNTVNLVRKNGNTDNLDPYSEGGNLDSETIRITCQVVALEKEIEQTLTNIAWIAEEVDGETQEVITTQEGRDRDSTPGVHPEYNKDNMDNYTGDSSNPSDLGNEDTYYKGMEDDDDFEKVVVPKAKPGYKLQLVKVDSENENQKLSGAQFKITLPNGEQKTVTTINDILNIDTIEMTEEGEDTIEIEEVTPPKGYKKLIGSITLKITKSENDGQIVVSDAKMTEDTNNVLINFDQNTVKITVLNEPNVFDLSARKFAVAVSKDQSIEDSEYSKGDDGKYTREPKVDTSKLNTVDNNGNLITTAVYNHTKEALEAKVNDYVVYAIRVYNEGNVDGYAGEIKDHLPEYLDFVDGDFNKGYGWVLSEDKRTVTTKFLENKKIDRAEELDAQGEDGKSGQRYNLSYEDVLIMCKINKKALETKAVVNIADITEYLDENGTPVEDRDSKENNVDLPEDKDLPDYKSDEKGPYVPGQEDDDDFEKVIVKTFDLALRKFITKIQDENIDSRVPQVKYDKQKDQISYEHSKEPVVVVDSNTVEYTIRVFNEGETNGYAAQVVDNIPNELQFLPNNATNVEYKWKMYRKLKSGENAKTLNSIQQDGETYVETSNVNEADLVATDYLSKENGENRMKEEQLEENPNLLKAFDKNAEISDTNPNYKDIKIAFTVQSKNSNVIVNLAQISKDTDEDGNDVEDKDSEPGKYTEGEDDQDKEYLQVKHFDLNLKKWTTQAIVVENGKQTVIQTGHKPEDNPEQVVKVEIKKSKLNKVTIKFKYSIRVTNEGDIEGYAKEITDYIPEGLKFVSADNKGWTNKGNNVIVTRQLENKLLKPGEHADVEVVLTWVNDDNNLGTVLNNTAEISEDYNEYGAPDKDSVPNNKKIGEDDIDDAPVILSIKTGQETIYYTLVLTILITVAVGLILIKKYII